MKRYTYSLLEEESNNKKIKPKIDSNKSIFLYINKRSFKISKKSNNKFQGVKYNLLCKTPFVLLGVENDIYLVDIDNVNKVKKYIYKNFINKNIIITNKINPLLEKEDSIFSFKEGLDIKELDFLNIEDLKEIEKFKIAKFKEENQKNGLKKDFKIINITTEEKFNKEYDKIKHAMKNINSDLDTNNIDDYVLNILINSLSKINEKEKIKYYDWYYENLKREENFLIINREFSKKLINCQSISSIEISEDLYDFYFQDPFGENYKYKIFIKYLSIKSDKVEHKLYCFKDDYLRNNPFKLNKNKTLIEI